MLYWTAPDTVFFPIREYVFSEIDGDGYEMEIGRIDAQFASSFETVSGEYVYGVTPVDAGGNRGALSTIKDGRQPAAGLRVLPQQGFAL